MSQENKETTQSGSAEKKQEPIGVKETFYDKIPLTAKQLDVIIIILIIAIIAVLALGIFKK